MAGTVRTGRIVDDQPKKQHMSLQEKLLNIKKKQLKEKFRQDKLKSMFYGKGGAGNNGVAGGKPATKKELSYAKM